MGELRGLVRPGMRIALADGIGSPTSVLGELSDAARDAGEVDLLLGWAPLPLHGLDLDAFREVRTIMAGYGLRGPVDAGRVRYVPARLGTLASLLHGALRPDLLVGTVSAGPPTLTTEVAWMRAAVDAGALVAAVERPAAPALDVSGPLPTDRLQLVGSDPSPPATYAWPVPGDVHRAVAERVVPLIPAGARVQHGPGQVGMAVLDALRQPVRIDTGLVTDAVVRLEQRGLLVGQAVTPYLAGTAELYEWARTHVHLDRLEVTHDEARLATGEPFVAVNTALEIDLDGQVNVEAAGGSALAGVGGQPDFASGAARSPHGISIVATPTTRGGHPTLVERLSMPASTPSHEVEVVVTEHGVADLRGLDRAERRRAIAALWT